MSTVSASMREKSVPELTQELEAVRAMVQSLQAYLKQLRRLKTDLYEMNSKYKELGYVNAQFIDVINKK